MEESRGEGVLDRSVASQQHRVRRTFGYFRTGAVLRGLKLAATSVEIPPLERPVISHMLETGLVSGHSMHGAAILPLRLACLTETTRACIRHSIYYKLRFL